MVEKKDGMGDIEGVSQYGASDQKVNVGRENMWCEHMRGDESSPRLWSPARDILLWGTLCPPRFCLRGPFSFSPPLVFSHTDIGLQDRKVRLAQHQPQALSGSRRGVAWHGVIPASVPMGSQDTPSGCSM